MEAEEREAKKGKRKSQYSNFSLQLTCCTLL